MVDFNIDDILLNASYKNKKGYIDINSQDDIKFLENIMYEMKYPGDVVTEFVNNLAEGRPWEHTTSTYEFNETGIEKLNKLGSDYVVDSTFSVEDTISFPAYFVKGTSIKLVDKSDLSLYTGDEYTYWKSDSGNMTVIIRKGNGTSIMRQAGKGIRPSEYEVLICIAYNMKVLKVGVDDAIKAAEIPDKDIVRAKFLYTNNMDITNKLSKNLKYFGNKPLIHTGKSGIKKSVGWPGRNSTPKTDVSNGVKHRISVKKEHGSRLMSATKDEMRGTFIAAQRFYEDRTDKRTKLVHIAKIIKRIEEEFERYDDIHEGVGALKLLLYNEYKEFRKLELKKQGYYDKYKDGDIERHVSAEANKFNITAYKIKPNEKNFIEEIPQPKDASAFIKYFKTKSETDSDLKLRMLKIFDLSVIHNEIEVEIENIFKNINFKKWIIYEAASGVYKFTGTPSLVNETNEISIANEIMVFNSDTGKSKIFNIDEKWAIEHANTVQIKVAFKSALPTTYSSFQILTTEDAGKNENFIESIVDEEINLFYQNVDSLNMVGESVADIKLHLRDMYGQLKNFIAEFYENVMRKIYEKIKDFAKQGLDFLLQMLGIEMEGTAEVDLEF